MATRSKKPLSARKISALKQLARKIDASEGNAIRSRGRAIFQRHESLRAMVRALREERRRRGLSLSEISARTGIAKPNLSRLENSEQISPTLDTLERYARAVGMTVRAELVAADAV